MCRATSHRCSATCGFCNTTPISHNLNQPQSRNFCINVKSPILYSLPSDPQPTHATYHPSLPPPPLLHITNDVPAQQFQKTPHLLRWTRVPRYAQTSTPKRLAELSPDNFHRYPPALRYPCLALTRKTRKLGCNLGSSFSFNNNHILFLLSCRNKWVCMDWMRD